MPVLWGFLVANLLFPLVKRTARESACRSRRSTTLMVRWIGASRTRCRTWGGATVFVVVVVGPLTVAPGFTRGISWVVCRDSAAPRSGCRPGGELRVDSRLGPRVAIGSKITPHGTAVRASGASRGATSGCPSRREVATEFARGSRRSRAGSGATAACADRRVCLRDFRTCLTWLSAVRLALGFGCGLRDARVHRLRLCMDVSTARIRCKCDG